LLLLCKTALKFTIKKMFPTMKKMFSLLLIATCLLESCKKDDPTPNPTCNTAGITYTNTVKAIFTAKCATSGCHVTSATIGALSTFAESKQKAMEGKIVGAIKREAGFSPMPKVGNKLSDCEISQIEAWIAAGTPE
jgi:hypothetical protein